MSAASGQGESGGASNPVPEIPEVFEPGCVVGIESCFNERFQGEVVAFDHTSKALILKCQTPDRKTTDVRLVNLLYMGHIEIEREAVANTPSPPAQVNIDKVRSRMKKHVEERKKMAAAIAKGVTFDGISLFLAIRKTIEEVTWHDQDILVMNSVRIQPPYQPENCVPSNDSTSSEHQSVAHVRNIVEKHLKDLKQQEKENSRGSATKDNNSA